MEVRKKGLGLLGNCRGWGVVCLVVAALLLGSALPSRVRGMEPPSGNQGVMSAHGTQHESEASLHVSPSARADDQSAEYIMQPGDQLQIKVLHLPELGEKEKIRPDGKISLLRLNDIQAAGLTPTKLSKVLSHDYAKFYRKPTVTVIVQNFAPLGIYVGGQVTHPSLLPFRYGITAVQALFEAGGARKTADLKDAVIVRNSGQGKPIVIPLNIKKVLSGSSRDLKLKPYDLVFIPTTKIARWDQYVDQHIRQLLPITVYTGFSYLFNPTVVHSP